LRQADAPPRNQKREAGERSHCLAPSRT
jgi:hypothetical protein